MQKKIIGILVLTLLIATTVIPAMSEINNANINHKENTKTVDSDHDFYY